MTMTIAAKQTRLERTEAAETARAVFEKQKANRWRISRTTAAQRSAKLRRLGDAIRARRAELQAAIYEDFRKNPAETDLSEIFPVLSEINHTIAHLAGWMRPSRASVPLALFGTHAEIRLEAKGLVLILAPWNYPFNLAMVPVVAAISAGNCVILRPSGKVPATARFIQSLLGGLFDEAEVAVLRGDHALSDALLELPFDHVFFTGGAKIGAKVMASAAKHLATVTLELGGKSPVIIDQSADVRRAAERIMWGKFLNAGQTCVAPDYVLIHESRRGEFVEESKKVLAARYGATEDQRRRSPDFARIVSESSARGLSDLVAQTLQAGAKAAVGGTPYAGERYLAPTILVDVREDSPIMRDEIFGPILPVLTWRDLDEAIRLVQSRSKPLALYVFSKDRDAVERVLSNTTAGGTCVNSLIIHLANPNLPFGGVGASGQGNYHGYFGFRTLSHERAVLRQGAFDSLRWFYPPYTPTVRRLIKLAMRYLA